MHPPRAVLLPSHPPKREREQAGCIELFLFLHQGKKRKEESVGFEPVATRAAVDRQGDAERGGALHLFADNPADNI